MLWETEDIKKFIEETPGYATEENVFRVLEEYVNVEDIYFPPRAIKIFTRDNCGFRADYDNSKAALYARCTTEQSIDLVRFRNFPGSLHKFECRFYRLPGEIWTSNKKNDYCYKQELFSILIQQLELPGKIFTVIEGHVKRTYTRRTEADHIYRAIYGLCDMYLECKERTLLNGTCELTEIPWNRIYQFREELRRIFRKKSSYDGNMFTINVFKKAIERKFDTVCPELYGPDLQTLLSTIENELDFETHPWEYLFIARVVLTFVTKCDMFIKNNEPWFIASEEGGQQPLIIRKFKIGSNKNYVFLASEFLEYIRRRNSDGGVFERELENMTRRDELATWTHNVGVDFEEVEYIEYSVRKTRRRGIYIPYDKTKYCILAYDAFTELLRWLIFTKKLFLRMITKDTKDTWRILITQIVLRFRKFRETDPPQLMSLEEVEEVRQFAKIQLKFLYRNSPPQSADDDDLEDFFVRIESKNSNPTDFEKEERLLARNPCMSEILDIKEQIIKTTRTIKNLEPNKKLPLYYYYQATEVAQLTYIHRKMYCLDEWIQNQSFDFH